MTLGGPNLITLATLLALCACQAGATPSKLETLVSGDLQSAQALAVAAGDTDGTNCWTYLYGLSQQWPQTAGAAVAVELARIPHTGQFVSACNATLLSGAIPALLQVP